MPKILTAALLAFLCAIAPVVSAQATPKHQQIGPPRYSPSTSLSVSSEPEDAGVANGSYSNEYFKLDFPLLAGWREDVKGPVPAASGYYVLGRLRTQGDLKGMVSIDAQDMFFAPFPVNNALDFAQRREHQATVLSQEAIDHAPREIQLAGHQFVRLDYSGASFHHAEFYTVVRCHIVAIKITSRFPEIFKKLDDNMAQLSLLDIANPAAGGGPVPVCVKDYASDATVIHRVDPVLGPLFAQIPVRFVIDTKGKVKHIHVLNSLQDQAKAIEDALAQWVFKPYVQNGQPVELETGILFEFPPKNRRQETAASKH